MSDFEDERTSLLDGRRSPEPSQARNDSTHSTKTLLSMFIPMTIGLFLVAADGTIVVSSYTAIGNEMKELRKTSWIATGYLLTLTSFQPMYGRLSLIFGKKRTLLFAYIVFTLGCFFCGLARNMNQLVLARALAGVGGGGISTVSTIILTTIVPMRTRGTWQGVLNLVFSVGSAIGGPLGGLLSESLGWRWSFHLQVPAMTLALIIVYINLQLEETFPSDWRTNLQRLDLLGASILIFAVASLLLGLERLGDSCCRDKRAWASLILSFVSFIVFLLVEFKIATDPITPKRIVFQRSLCASYFANFFAVGASMSLFFYVALYMQAVMGKTAGEAGMLLLPSVAGGAIGSLCGGLMIQLTGGFYYQTISGYMALLLGCIMVTLSSGVWTHSIMALSGGFAIAGYGNGHGITTCFVALISTATSEDQAIATSVSYLFRSLGSVVALSVGSAVIQGVLARALSAKVPRDSVDDLVRRVQETLDNLEYLDETTRLIVRDSYEIALRTEFILTCTLALCAIVCAAVLER